MEVLSTSPFKNGFFRIKPDIEVGLDFDKLKNEKIDTQIEKAKEIADSKM